ADAVAQDRAAGEGARRIDRDDANGAAALALLLRHRGRQRALARACRSGDANGVRAAGARIEQPQRLAPLWPFVARPANHPRQRPTIARQQPLDVVVRYGCHAGVPTLSRTYSTICCVEVPGPKIAEKPISLRPATSSS